MSDDNEIEASEPDEGATSAGPGGYDSSFLDAAFKAVPSAGDGHRWYDFVYRLVRWPAIGWRRRAVPRRVRLKLLWVQTCLMRINDHARNKAWSHDDPMHAYSVPAEERVEFPSVWVVELFPPSQIASLLEASSRSGWDKHRVMGQLENNHTILQQARGGRGWFWWRLAQIADPRAGYTYPDGMVAKLPDPFISVELRAVTVGDGLTAVVGRFNVDPGAVEALNVVWHTEHEPTLYWRDRQLHAEDPMWSGFRITQEARRRFHDAARGWMRAKVPGFFANTDEPHLLMDLALSRVHDPTIERENKDQREWFRALGLTGFEVEHRSSPDLPGLLLGPVEPNMCPTMNGQNAWTVFGQRDAVVTAFGKDLTLYGEDPARAIAHAVDESIRMFLIALALSAYTRAAQAQHAALRDGATKSHRRFSSRQVKKLRSALLTLSLDLAGMQRDVAAFWRRQSRTDPLITFSASLAPWITEQWTEHGHAPDPPVDINKRIRKQQQTDLRILVESDNDYRDILTTVTSLGTSTSATRVGRAALVIAATSLVVSAVTLTTTKHNDNSDGDMQRPTTVQPTPLPTASTPASPAATTTPRKPTPTRSSR